MTATNVYTEEDMLQAREEAASILDEDGEISDYEGMTEETKFEFVLFEVLALADDASFYRATPLYESELDATALDGHLLSGFYSAEEALAAAKKRAEDFPESNRIAIQEHLVTLDEDGEVYDCSEISEVFSPFPALISEGSKALSAVKA